MQCCLNSVVSDFCEWCGNASCFGFSDLNWQQCWHGWSGYAIAKVDFDCGRFRSLHYGLVWFL